MKPLLNYFLRGMLITFPLSATIYLIVVTLNWLNDLFNKLLFGQSESAVPGLGILLGFLLITLVGFLFTRTFVSPLVNAFEQLLRKTPIISIIYSSIKELTEAFVGDEKKFTEPVKIQVDGGGVYRFGFITRRSLEKFDMEDMVAVYCPHSYNVSGNLYIVAPINVTPITTDPADFMRFIVSGGVTRVNGKGAELNAGDEALSETTS